MAAPRLASHHVPRDRRPVLVIGAAGMLGQAWTRTLTQAGIPCVAPARADLDITSAASVRNGISSQFRLVVNCSGYTDVDGAEADLPTAWRVNAAGVGQLAEQCAHLGIPLIHHSTDYVFDGCATAPYTVQAPRGPINVYGHSKAAGEAMLEKSGCEYLLLRTSWLYAPWGRNFLRTMGTLVGNRSEVRVVNDQRGCPTSAEWLAWAGWRLAELQCRGTFHVTDAGDCTWWELAAFIRDQLEADCHVTPCSSRDYLRPARRPAYSVLDHSATEAIIGPARSWQHSVAMTLERAFPATNRPAAVLAT